MSSTIQKRTTQVRDDIKHEWQKRWWQFIIDNRDKDLCGSLIAENPNYTMKDINDNPTKVLNWYGISQNPNITMKFINDNPNKHWNWFDISMNPSITMKDILDNPAKYWCWSHISMNPSITMKDILDNPEKPWHWYWISSNPFTKEKEEFRERMYREHLAAVLIQNAYKNALVNPNCQLGLNRIERDMVLAGVM